MFEFMLECHLLMLFLILLRALFGSFLSAKMRYALWLFIPLRFLPFGLLFEAGKQTVLVKMEFHKNMFQRKTAQPEFPSESVLFCFSALTKHF